MPLSLQEQYDKVYKYCYFKVKNQHQAEDITQETFLRFFNNNRYVSRGKPLAYLYTIARNLCIDSYRKKETHQIPTQLPDPTTATQASETSIALKASLKTLPPETQEILLLRYANDLSIGEIASFTGLSRFAIRRKINSALSKLKTTMREEDFT